MCKRANAAIYIEEGRLETVRNSLGGGSAELRPMEFISKYRTTDPGAAPLGLVVCGYQFSYRQPEDLVELFASAITELEAAPR